MNVGTKRALETIHEFWDWWSDELGEMLPKNMRGLPTERDRFEIFLSEEETVIETVQAGAGTKLQEPCALENLPPESWEEIEVLSENSKPRLFLTASEVLIVPVNMPKTSSVRLQQAIELQLPGLVPLQAHLLDWDFVEIERSEAGIELALIAVKSSRLETIEKLFAEQGLMPPTFCFEYQGKIAVLRKPLEIAARPLENRKMQSLMAAAAMIAMIPILTLTGAKLMTSVEQGRIERLESDLSSKLADDKRILKEEMVRRAAAPLLKLPSASNRLELIARHLPKTDWAISAAQTAEGKLEFTADMANRTLAEAELQKSKMFRNLEAVEELAPEGSRARVRYQVGR